MSSFTYCLNLAIYDVCHRHVKGTCLCTIHNKVDVLAYVKTDEGKAALDKFAPPTTRSVRTPDATRVSKPSFCFNLVRYDECTRNNKGTCPCTIHNKPEVLAYVKTTEGKAAYERFSPPGSNAETRPDFCFEGISSGVSSNKCYIRNCMKCHDRLLFDLACKSSPALMKAFKTYENTMSSKNQPTTKSKTKTLS